MLVSVIIPTYNSEKLLPLAVQSVLNQTHQNFEIIIVDDGSTDNTKQVVEDFKNPGIQYIYQQNAGPAAARNRGINAAKGEYIAFLDADDIWTPEKLELQLEVFKEKKDVCLVYSAIEMESEIFAGKLIRKYRNHKTKEGLIKELLLNMGESVLFPSTVMIKKTYLDKTGYFDVELYTGEDWDLWMRLASLQNFYSIEKVLVKAFKPKVSLTNSLSIDETEKYHRKILSKFFNNPENGKKFKHIMPDAYSYQYYLFAIILFYNRKDMDLNKIIQNLVKSFCYSPLHYVMDFQKVKFSIKVLLIYLRLYKRKEDIFK